MQLHGSEHRPGQGVSAAVWRLSLLIGQCGPRRGTFGKTPAAWLLVLLNPALGNRPLGHAVCPHPSAPRLHTHSLFCCAYRTVSLKEQEKEGERKGGLVALCLPCPGCCLETEPSQRNRIPPSDRPQPGLGCFGSSESHIVFSITGAFLCLTI